MIQASHFSSKGRATPFSQDRSTTPSLRNAARALLAPATFLAKHNSLKTDEPCPYCAARPFARARGDDRHRACRHQATREAYDKISLVTKDNAKVVSDAVLAAQAGTKTLGELLVHNTSVNTAAVFDAAQAIVRAKSIPEAARLQADFMQKGLQSPRPRPRNCSISPQKSLSRRSVLSVVPPRNLSSIEPLKKTS